MPLEIRLIKDSEYKAANDFFNNARSVDHSSQKTIRSFENFSWEFINGPCGKAIYVVALDICEGKEPEIVGLQCAIPLKLISSSGKTILTAKGEDTFVDIKAMIKYRKTDILKEMYDLVVAECRKEGIEYMWGFNDILATIKRVGFDIPFKSSYGVLVFKPLQSYKYLVSLNPKNKRSDKIKIAGLVIISFLLSLKRNFIRRINKEYIVSEGLEPNVDLFSRSNSGNNELFFLLQDADFLKWRISENPYPIKYISFQLYNKEQKFLAQIIVSANENRIAFFEQIIFDVALENKQRKRFMKYVQQSIIKQGVVLVRSLGFKSNEINMREMTLLKNFGFVFTDRGEYFAFRRITEKEELNPYHIFLSRLYKQGRN